MDALYFSYCCDAVTVSRTVLYIHTYLQLNSCPHPLMIYFCCRLVNPTIYFGMPGHLLEPVPIELSTPSLHVNLAVRYGGGLECAQQVLQD